MYSNKEGKRQKRCKTIIQRKHDEFQEKKGRLLQLRFDSHLNKIKYWILAFKSCSINSTTYFADLASYIRICFFRIMHANTSNSVYFFYYANLTS